VYQYVYSMGGTDILNSISMSSLCEMLRQLPSDEIAAVKAANSVTVDGREWQCVVSENIRTVVTDLGLSCFHNMI
jgi:hypothetical protein